jgi:hypothetical protein
LVPEFMPPADTKSRVRCELCIAHAATIPDQLPRAQLLLAPAGYVNA